MSDRKFIPSILVEDQGVNEDLEEFAVFYNFLKSIQPEFLAEQKRRLRNGIILLIIAAFFLSIEITDILAFIPFMVNLGLFMILVIIGLLCLINFFMDHPDNIKNFQKIYFPLAIIRSRDSTEGKYLLYDPTRKLNGIGLSYLSVDFDEIDSIITDMPVSLKDHDKEEEMNKELKKLTATASNNKIRQSILSPAHLKDVETFCDMIKIGRRDGPSKKTIPLVHDIDDIKRMNRDLVESQIDAKNNIDFLKKQEKTLRRKVDNFWVKLEKMADQEYIHGTIRLGRYFEDTYKMMNIFDKIEENFLSILKTDILMNKELFLNEINNIDKNFKRQKDSLLNDFNRLEKQIERSDIKDGGELMGDLIEAKDTAIDSLGSLTGYLETLYKDLEGYDKRTLIGKGDIQLDYKTYKNRLSKVLKKINFIGGVLNREEIESVNLNLLYSIKKTTEILLEDVYRLNRSIDRFKKNKKEVSNPIDQLFDQKMKIDKYLRDVPSILMDEVYYHIEPLSERKMKLTDRANDVFDGFEKVVDSCYRFQKTISDLTIQSDFQGDPTGLYYFPFLRIEYNEDSLESKVDEIYSIGRVNDRGILDTQVFGAGLIDSVGDVLKDHHEEKIGFDSEDILKHAESFKETYDVSSFEYYICKRGVKNLVKNR